MELYELPEGWKWKRLGDREYFDLKMGQSPPSHTYNLKAEGLPFFQGKAEFGDLHLLAKKHCSAPTRIALKDDVLISVRAPVGPTSLADRECCIGRGLAAIRCKAKVLPSYLLYALRDMESKIAATVQDQGGGFTAIKRNQLADIEIPLPSLDEQHRIVARIEEISRRVEEARRLHKESQAGLDKVIPSVLSKAFRGEL